MLRRRLVPSCTPAVRRPRRLVGRRSTRSWRAASAESCRSTARARSRSPASTSTSAARTRQSARYAGWRIAQRAGFQGACGRRRTSGRSAEAPNLPDSTLDELVSSIIVEREQIGPNRYIADLGILFDRAARRRTARRRRRGPAVGADAADPGHRHGGHATTVELRNAWQRAWAQFRTSQSPIDYVRVSGHGSRPAAGQCGADRPARAAAGGATSSISTAPPTSWSREVQLQRLYPGGPARARFIGRHGPDNELVGGFTI